MTESTAVIEYWQAYLEEHPEAADQYDSAWAFGDNPQLADELLELVLKGIKTGTASNYALYEVRGLRLPFAGGHSILLDGGGEPRGIIETVKVEIVPFDEVTAEFAYSEGEDDRSLASWRHEHEKYFKRECESLGRPFDPAMKVVCENFRVVHVKQR